MPDRLPTSRRRLLNLTMRSGALEAGIGSGVARFDVRVQRQLQRAVSPRFSPQISIRRFEPTTHILKDLRYWHIIYILWLGTDCFELVGKIGIKVIELRPDHSEGWTCT